MRQLVQVAVGDKDPDRMSQIDFYVTEDWV